jgi:hypothetical protein
MGGSSNEGSWTYLDVSTAHAQSVDGSLDAGLSARGIDDDICASAELALLDEVRSVLLCADARALEARRRSVLQRKLQPVVVDVDCDNLLRAIGLGHGTAQQADGAGAKHYNRVAVLDRRLPCDVHRDSCGLDQGTLLHAHVLGQLVAVVFGERVVLCQRAVVWGRRGEGHVGAQVVLALLAADAATAGHAGLHGDAVAYLQVLDLVTNLVNDACRLVTEDHRRLDDKVSNAALNPVVHVGSADTGPSWLDDYVVWRGQFWDRAVFVNNFVLGLEDERWVLQDR